MADAAASKIMPPGSKALAPSGIAVVGVEFSPDPVALGRPANTLLSVMPVKQHTEPTYGYLRQTVRTSNAAVVAEGGANRRQCFLLCGLKIRSTSSRTSASRAQGIGSWIRLRCNNS